MGHMYFSTSWHDKVSATRHDPIYSKGTYSRLGPHQESIWCHNFDQVGIDFSNFFFVVNQNKLPHFTVSKG